MPWIFVVPRSAPPLARPLLLAALASLLALPPEADAAARRGRYREMPGHPWLEDGKTGRFPHAHCELRVPRARALPQPLTSAATGDLLASTYVTDVTMESAGIVLTEDVVDEVWRTWLWRDMPDATRLTGRAQLVVTVRWPRADRTLRAETSEAFTLPPLDALPPYRWSPWRRADQLRRGEHAAYEALTGAPTSALAPPEHPFELRCRTVLSTELPVPAASADDNIGRDESGRLPSPPP